MSNLIDLKDYRKATRKGTRASFTREELRLLLDTYSRRVASGEWKDYAIDLYGPVALFSIFRNTYEMPTFSISKKQIGKGYEYALFHGRHSVRKARSLEAIISILNKPLRLVEKLR